MKCAIIDIGSNTIRLIVYQVDGSQYEKLITKKKMVGLVGYVVEGQMTEQGIRELIKVLHGFCEIVNYIQVDYTYAFATASLRNIMNADEIVEKIYKELQLKIQILSGEEEARLSFAGAMSNHYFSDGCLFDLGGGSTEVVMFSNGKPNYIESLDMGCLNLYKAHVKNILPNKKEIKNIKKYIKKKLSSLEINEKSLLLIGVGGTARSVKRLVCNYKGYDSDCYQITKKDLDDTVEFLLKRDHCVKDLLLKKCSDRLHTIIPGILIMQAIAKKTGAKIISISNYGVREGYILENVIKHNRSEGMVNANE